ncbi:MAG: peptidoglycan DD-metalloendopeptidase family protein [Scytolyngbya sp. HA4215-MV1]|jgi:murein DD-endopeptidase MepM/ murein hydrolase activator NlpD|nr:peptidoglycan DD-metalloendopeptidase family protein [Scytolyngbya sp. HA4215-MV1]
MTRSLSAAQSSLLSWQRSLLISGIGCLAGIGLLGNSLQPAQATQPSGAVTVISEPSTPAAQAATTESLGIAAPETVPILPETTVPATPVPTAPATEELPLVNLNRPAPQSTSTYDSPTQVILTERSSGCQTVLRQGQAVPGDLCGREQAAQAARNHQPQNWSIATPSRVSVASPSSQNSTSWQAYYKLTARPQGRLGNGNLNLLFPLPIPAIITSAFGWRVHPISGAMRFHSGTDLGAPLGTPVLAAYTGQVALADFLGGYGLTVALEHQKGKEQTLYAHLSEIFVKPGEWVQQGTVIGRVGSTGNSTGPHLHFEFRQLTDDGWVALDPGVQLEFALAQLIKTLEVAQAGSGKSKS